MHGMQDFLKEVDLQFLDHMRRGTSINFADLASDPPPASMQASWKQFSCRSVLHSVLHACSGCLLVSMSISCRVAASWRRKEFCR